MCGRFFVVNSEKINAMLHFLQIPLTGMRFSADIAPGSTVSIIFKDHDEVRLTDATWWLLLDQKTCKPNYRYASFNSRSDKLHQTGSLAYSPYRESRCIIPASGFVEGLGDKKTYHQIELRDQAIAFGGIFRTWIHPNDQEALFSASIITLPPHPKWASIHKKAFPLMLPWQNKEIVKSWLDPSQSSVDIFERLLTPRLNVPQVITPIDRPSKRNPQGPSFCLAAEGESGTENE